MALNHSLLPSRASQITMLLLSALSALVVFAGLSPDVNCGAGSWDCATLSGIALVSVSLGIGFGLFLAACLVFLASAARRVLSVVPAFEAKGRTTSVVVAMLLAQLAVFGAINLSGTLPLGWWWWLGALGFIGIGLDRTGVYLLPGAA
jgi:hypothetical protein